MDAQERAKGLLREFGVVRPPVADGLVFSVSSRLTVKLADMPEDLPGLLVYGDRLDIIWLRREDSEARRRFSLWHEVGHYLMHPGIFYCYAIGTQEQRVEREANTFTAELLMPAAWVWEDVRGRGPNASRLAARYRVSVMAMRRRFRELGIDGR